MKMIQNSSRPYGPKEVRDLMETSGFENRQSLFSMPGMLGSPDRCRVRSVLVSGFPLHTPPSGATDSKSAIKSQVAEREGDKPSRGSNPPLGFSGNRNRLATKSPVSQRVKRLAGNKRRARVSTHNNGS